MGPEAPGARDATDPGLFPRPLIGDGELTGPTEEQMRLPAAEFAAGQCDPRIMRPALAAIPGSMTLKAQWHVPLAIVMQPLADFGNAAPVIDGTASRPILRCTSCRSYMSPFNTWLDGGRYFRCCICARDIAVPEDAFAPLGADGRRVDEAERPELTRGTVEFIAPEQYAVRPPMPPSYFFVIDVSQAAAASGALAAVCAAIAATLDELAARNPLTRVGFLTFDSCVHFYNLNGNLAAPQMMLVADIADPFSPLPDDHYVSLEGSRGTIDALLDALPAMFAGTSELETALGAALQAAFRTMCHLGGKLLLFTSSPSTLGSCAVTKNREVAAHYNSEREAALRQPADPFFKNFTAECIEKQICVDIFALAPHYCDLFSLDTLPRYTGGSLHFYPSFHAARDGAKLQHELQHNLLRPTAWEAVMRVRCSKGMRMSTFHGHLFVRQNDLVALPAVSADDTFVAQMTMEDTVLAGERVFVQCALLYTSSTSERRIRVHTLALPVVANVYELFEKADAAGIAATLGKLAVEKAQRGRLDETRRTVEGKLVSQLHEFKSLHQGHFRRPAHLAFPRSLRFALPWTHGVLRSNALRGAGELSPDERCALMSLLVVRRRRAASIRYHRSRRLLACRCLGPCCQASVHAGTPRPALSWVRA